MFAIILIFKHILIDSWNLCVRFSYGKSCFFSELTVHTQSKIYQDMSSADVYALAFGNFDKKMRNYKFIWKNIFVVGGTRLSNFWFYQTCIFLRQNKKKILIKEYEEDSLYENKKFLQTPIICYFYWNAVFFYKKRIIKSKSKLLFFFWVLLLLKISTLYIFFKKIKKSIITPIQI